MRRSARGFGIDLCGERRATVLDRVAGVVLIAGVAPVMSMIGVVILATSPRGPVVFRIACVDAFGREYNLLRFRTFELDPGGIAGLGNQWPYAFQPTAFGAVLRRTNLDHLPYLVSVAHGDIPLMPYGVTWRDAMRSAWRNLGRL